MNYIISKTRREGEALKRQLRGVSRILSTQNSFRGINMGLKDKVYILNPKTDWDVLTPTFNGARIYDGRIHLLQPK